ncbi:hypothetical protein CYMTET_7724 [Cymbomonas tetramitiformis]|uniref:Uncharacterized protein n=1 Tax=Cymbomonas tetramitiformis TaxID=36881 RepID=A0AAE0GV27_9CHLO|nr:hypothetical protein CYMTET_7724 [Cymbomonas tetramitiformis]
MDFITAHSSKHYREVTGALYPDVDALMMEEIFLPETDQVQMIPAEIFPEVYLGSYGAAHNKALLKQLVSLLSCASPPVSKLPSLNY